MPSPMAARPESALPPTPAFSAKSSENHQSKSSRLSVCLLESMLMMSVSPIKTPSRPSALEPLTEPPWAMPAAPEYALAELVVLALGVVWRRTGDARAGRTSVRRTKYERERIIGNK